MKLIETYFYYDRPLLFLGEHEGVRYMTVLADETEDVDTWSCVEVSPEEVEAFKAGSVELHILYSEPFNRHAMIVAVGNKEVQYFKTEASLLPNEYRPKHGFHLNR